MRKIIGIILSSILLTSLFGCSTQPTQFPTKTKPSQANMINDAPLATNTPYGTLIPHITRTPLDTTIPSSTEIIDYVPDGKGVLNITIMVHLEGWQDDKFETFNRHASLLLELADLFEKYGAKLTLESKEFTEGCILFDNNVLGQLEDRGHGIGVHADIGGKRSTTQRELTEGIREMKFELETLGVSVRHVSGICSDKDWVEAALDAGFEAVTGVVSYSLWSLDENLRPEGFEPYKNPGEGHASYPWEVSGQVTPWRADDGSDWIFPSDDGLLIIPSGGGLTFAYEESIGESNGAGSSTFDDKDISAWRNLIDEALLYTDSNRINTYYAAWSFGAIPNFEMMEKWLQLLDEYVQDGRIVWTTIPEMIDLYEDWEASN